jgi:uncharacterized membrane protein
MTVLRTLLALVIVLVAPGYLLLLILFPRGGPRDAERVMLVIGTSLAVSVIAGLALQLTPQGITGARVDWVLGALVLLLAVGAAVRVWRDRRRTFSVRTTTRTYSARESSNLRLRAVMRGVPLLIAALLGVVAVALARNDAIRVSRGSSFTQLWLVPDRGGAELGVESFEHGARRFLITVTAGSQTLSWTAVTVDGGATYTRHVPLTRRQMATKRIEARLFVGSGIVPYRTVSWTPRRGGR